MTRRRIAMAAVIGCSMVVACRPAGGDPYVDPPQAFDPTGWPLVDKPGEPGYMPQIQTGDPPPRPSREVSPEDVAQDVASSLRADPITADAPILVYADRGVVVLGGTVPTMQAERQAMTIALAVPGAGTVISRMQIDTPVRHDAEVQIEVEQALIDEPAVDAPEVAVQVDDGNLRLVGVVASEAERFLAEHVAAGVAGVRSIQNRLQISTPLARADDELETTITRRLEVDPELGEAELEVDVDERTVWLTGVVPDERAFDRARWIATRAAAVRDVDTKGVVIGVAPSAVLQRQDATPPSREAGRAASQR